MTELLERVRTLGYPTFQELFNSGKVVMDELDKYVEIWEQELAGNCTLEQALGFDSHAFTDWRHPASRVMKDYQHKMDFLAGKTAWSPFPDQMPLDTPVLAKHKLWITPQVVRRLANQPSGVYRVGPEGKILGGMYPVSAIFRWSLLSE
jgi:hypothetical protein